MSPGRFLPPPSEVFLFDPPKQPSRAMPSQEKHVNVPERFRILRHERDAEVRDIEFKRAEQRVHVPSRLAERAGVRSGGGAARNGGGALEEELLI